jgi:hypothetical protein
MSEDFDQAAAKHDAAKHAERIERLAAMFLAALITTNKDMDMSDEIKLSVTYAERLALQIDLDRAW